VTFVVLTWNGRSLLEVVLPSIFAQTSRGFAVHVVDDGSTDDSQGYVEREWPQAVFFAHDANVGLTANMGRALDTVTTGFVALLNNDLELDPNWLAEMLAALECHPDAAAADCRMLNFYDRTLIDGAGDLLDYAMQPGRRGHGEPAAGRYEEVEEIFCVSFGAALLRARAIDDVGPLDNDLVAYYDDFDWGFRARLLGYTAIYVPTAIAYHMGSTTTNRDPGRWTHLFPRNRIYLIVKNLPGALLVRYLPRIVVAEVSWLGRDLRRGHGRNHLKALWQAFLMLPLALRKRREIQRSRRVSSSELVAALTPLPGVLEGLGARLRGHAQPAGRGTPGD